MGKGLEGLWTAAVSGAIGGPALAAGTCCVGSCVVGGAVFGGLRLPTSHSFFTRSQSPQGSRSKAKQSSKARASTTDKKGLRDSQTETPVKKLQRKEVTLTKGEPENSSRSTSISPTAPQVQVLIREGTSTKKEKNASFPRNHEVESASLLC